jgi:hypothetical protein
MIIYIVVDTTNNYNIACFDSLEKAETMVADYNRIYRNRTYLIEKHGVK